LAESGQGTARTVLFARYSLLGALFAALGALASGVPQLLVSVLRIELLSGFRVMFVLYGLGRRPRLWALPRRAVAVAGWRRDSRRVRSSARVARRDPPRRWVWRCSRSCRRPDNVPGRWPGRPRSWPGWAGGRSGIRPAGDGWPHSHP
jgi:hypothetical protein